jgi:hypothetical protein
MTEPVRRRSYEIWSDAENIQLVEWLRDGITLEDITNRLGRGVDAVSSHCEQMLTPETRAKRTDADLILRTHLADPNYDWRAALRSRAQLAGRIYWDQASEDILRAGWDQGRPLAELRADTGASELEVARHLVWLGLAETSTEVATQLGCDPHGTLAAGYGWPSTGPRPRYGCWSSTARGAANAPHHWMSATGYGRTGMSPSTPPPRKRTKPWTGC